MYADNTLTPKETTRLCALGLLVEGDMRYSDLASRLRQFITGILGPSLDVLGSSIELLKYERLAEAIDGKGLEDNAVLRITDRGRDEFKLLLTAPVRAQSNDMNKLVVALKFRFLHLLETENQRDQIDLLMDAAEAELARLEDLQIQLSGDACNLAGWLSQEIQSVQDRIKWLDDLDQEIANG